MNRTGIEYLDFTWNPVTGCTPVSDGCDNCWARAMHNRKLFGNRPFKEVTLHPDRLDEPFQRNKPARIGVCFMGDLFHKDIHRDFILRVWHVMERSPQHTFLVLTKRAERMHYWINEWLPGALTLAYFHEVHKLPLPNVWLGVSIEDQATADERIPWLLKTPVAHRWVSYEPALGPIDLEKYLLPACIDPRGTHDPEDCDERFLDWLVCGGESGPHARPMHLEWARSVRDQCRSAGVSFYMKQMSKRKPIPDDLMIREFPK